MYKEIQEIYRRLTLGEGEVIEAKFNEGDTRFYDIEGEKGVVGQVKMNDAGELYYRGADGGEWKKK